MIVNRLFIKFPPSKIYGNVLKNSFRFRCYNSVDNSIDTSPSNDHQNNAGVGNVSSTNQVFHYKNTETILDIREEQSKKHDLIDLTEIKKEYIFEGINLKRGHHGVFNIEDLIDVLKKENAQNVFVAEVPSIIKYVDYMCIVSGKSNKHMKAMSHFVKKVYKQKMDKTDSFLKIEGVDSKDWIAIDLGNIALHIFSQTARNTYDLDSLWSLGPEYDKEYNKGDVVAEVLEKHTFYLRDLQPAH